MPNDLAKWLANTSLSRLAIRQLTISAKPATDYTIGDWNPAAFPPPKALISAVTKHLKLNEVQYADVAGEAALRLEVAKHWQRLTGCTFSLDQIMVASGARPLLMLATKTLITPHDVALYFVPNWNAANYLKDLVAKDSLIRVVTQPKNYFLPSLEQLKPYEHCVNLLWFNLPLNPSNAIYTKEQWRSFLNWWRAVNAQRLKNKLKPLFVVLDAVYHQLADTTMWREFSEFRDLLDYAIIIDGAAKSYAATGMRLGWALGPSYLIERMVTLNSYLGSWPGTAEQRGMADFLTLEASFKSVNTLKAKLKSRALALTKALNTLKQANYPVDFIPYKGGIYFNCQLNFKGYHYNSAAINHAEDLANFLLKAAKIKIVSFKYLDAPEHEWWFRLALSMVTKQEHASAVSALSSAIKLLTK